jgi:uncharacterized membrane protein YedE/YeeE
MPDLSVLNSAVVWGSFAVAFCLGILMQRTNFCTMGAVADIANMQDWNRMRMWLLAIGVAIAGTQALGAIGLIDLSQSFYTGPRLLWVSHALGGLLFGIGMVLASGCGSKTLLRIGAGNLKSLVVFLVLGLFAYMTMRGVFGVLRVSTVDRAAIDLGVGQDLPRLFAGTTSDTLATWRWALGIVLGLGLAVIVAAPKEFRSNLNHWLGGLGVGGAIVATWAISGHLGYLAEHPETLDAAFLATNSGRMESLSFVAPVAYSLELAMLWSDKSKIVTLGIASVAGMVLGSFVYSVATRTFRWEGFANAEDTANHLVGGALMGIGGVTAVGCTVGQGLSGLSTLALGSMIAFTAMVGGGFLALRYQMWRIGV